MMDDNDIIIYIGISDEMKNHDDCCYSYIGISDEMKNHDDCCYSNADDTMIR